MASFEGYSQPTNPLLSYAQIDAQGNLADQGRLANQVTQQNLDDRTTLRGLAGGFAANDPNAAATAASLSSPADAVAALSGMHVDQQRALANTLNVTGGISGAILAAAPEQRAALWASLRPTMLRAGAPNTPEAYPGDDFLAAHRTAAATVQQQLELQAGVPTTDPTRGPLSAPGGPRVGPGGVMQQPQTGMPQGVPQGVLGPQTSNVGGAGGVAFASAAPNLITRVQAAFPQFTPEQAAGIVGTFGAESGGQAVNEVNPLVPGSRGGFGFAQWTGPRRVAFEQFAQANNLDPKSTDANIAFFANEFAQPQYDAVRAAVARARTPEEAAQAFQTYETGGAPSLAGAAMRYPPAARIAFNAYQQGRGGNPAQPPPEQPPVQVASSTNTAGMPQTATDASDPATPPAGPPVASGGLAAALANARQAVATRGQPASVAQPAPTVSVDGVIGAPSPDGQPVAGVPGLRLTTPTASPPPATVQVDGAGGPPPVVTPPPAQALPVFAPIRAPNALMPPGPFAAPPPNALLSAAQPPLAPPQVSGPAAQGATPPQTGAGGFPPAPPGSRPLYVRGSPIPIPGAEGFMRGIAPDGTPVAIPMPGAVNQGRLSQVPRADGGLDLVAPSGQVVSTTPPNSRDIQKADYERDGKEIGAIADAGQEANAQQIRIQAMRDMLANFSSGTGGTTRAQFSAAVQSFLPEGQAQDFLKRITGMSDPAAAQEFAKLALTSAGQQERGVLGARGGYQAIRLFQAANPNLDLLDPTNKAILAQQLVGAQANADYSQGVQAHFRENSTNFRNTTGAYRPISDFDQQWQQQRNPQVYAAAIAALSNAPAYDATVGNKNVHGWATGLNDQEYQRVLGVVSKADPRAVVNGRTGRLSMQPPDAQGVPQQQAPTAPAVGSVMQGHRFQGGDPSNPSSWVRVQ